MPEPVTVRLAEPADAGAIAALIAVLASDPGEPGEVSTDYIAEVLGKGSCRALLAMRGEGVLGVLNLSYHPSFYHAADACLIEELVVSSGARNEGVGSRLLEHAIQMAQAHGCAEISLAVLTSNAAARRFYERHGFEAEAISMERHFATE